MNEFTAQIEAALQNRAETGDDLVKVLSLVLAHLRSETGTIHQFDPKTRLLHLKTQIGLPSFMLETVKIIPAGKGIAGQTVVRGGPVTMCNLQTDTGGVAKPGAKQTGVGGALCVPIRRGDTVVGTLGVGTKRTHEYTPAETATLEDVASLLGRYLK